MCKLVLTLGVTFNFKIGTKQLIIPRRNYLPRTVGKQMGRMLSVIGTLSFNLNNAISLSKLRKLNDPAIALKTNLDSGRTTSLHRSCSPNVTLIMNHMNLQRTYKKNQTEKIEKAFFFCI